MPVYRGFRGQGGTGIGVSRGIFSSEGAGVYIALDKDLARDFAGSKGYLLELEFQLNRPIVVSNEPLYMLSEAEEVEEPVQDSDSDWLKANKLAYQWAMQKANNNWGKAEEFVGQFLTDALQDMGYDGVMVDQGKDNRWAVVFNPGNVKVLSEKRQAHVSREIRLARELVCSRRV